MHRVPLLGLHVRQQLVAGDAGVVDQDVQPVGVRRRGARAAARGASAAATSRCSVVPPIRLATLASASPAAAGRPTITCAPSRASTPAIAAPMPRAAPVTSAVLPASGWSQSAGAGRRAGAEQQRLPVDVGRLPDRKNRSADSSDASSSTQSRFAVAPRCSSLASERTMPSSACRVASTVMSAPSARAARARAPGRTAAASAAAARGTSRRPARSRRRRDRARVEDQRAPAVALARLGRAPRRRPPATILASAAAHRAGRRAEQHRAGQHRVAGAGSGAARPAGAARPSTRPSPSRRRS